MLGTINRPKKNSNSELHSDFSVITEERKPLRLQLVGQAAEFIVKFKTLSQDPASHLAITPQGYSRRLLKV